MTTLRETELRGMESRAKAVVRKYDLDPGEYHAILGRMKQDAYIRATAPALEHLKEVVRLSPPAVLLDKATGQMTPIEHPDLVAARNAIQPMLDYWRDYYGAELPPD